MTVIGFAAGAAAGFAACALIIVCIPTRGKKILDRAEEIRKRFVGF